ncbi:MAG: hypothetical protein AAGA05_09050 [Pseudomonadota bacterium]
MKQDPALWPDPRTHLTRLNPDHPVLCLAPELLQQTAARFQTKFEGLVTYAVKANDRVEVLGNITAAGIKAFDVASPAEMERVRAVLPDAILHYHNPVRSLAEITAGRARRNCSQSLMLSRRQRAARLP